MFGPGSIYHAIQWYWLVGALLPVLFYVIVRCFPRTPLRMLNAPVMLGAMAWLPPYVYLIPALLPIPSSSFALPENRSNTNLTLYIRATPLSFSTWAFFGLLFNYSIRSRY